MAREPYPQTGNDPQQDPWAAPDLCLVLPPPAPSIGPACPRCGGYPSLGIGAFGCICGDVSGVPDAQAQTGKEEHEPNVIVSPLAAKEQPEDFMRTAAAERAECEGVCRGILGALEDLSMDGGGKLPKTMLVAAGDGAVNGLFERLTDDEASAMADGARLCLETLTHRAPLPTVSSSVFAQHVKRLAEEALVLAGGQEQTQPTGTLVISAAALATLARAAKACAEALDGAETHQATTKLIQKNKALTAELQKGLRATLAFYERVSAVCDKLEEK